MIALPEGWNQFMYGSAVVWEIPTKGAVTIDENKRGFTLGIGGYITSRADIYTGRGWKDRLYADAINALQDVFKEPPA